MTAEERAIEVNEKIRYPFVIPFEVALIADAIRAAVAEEREACAKVAQSYEGCYHCIALKQWCDIPSHVADDIRTREKP